MGDDLPGGVDVKGRRAALDQALLDRLLHASPLADGVRHLRSMDLGLSTFIDDVVIKDAVIAGSADFAMATFQGDVRFENVTFEQGCSFASSTWRGTVVFEEVRFLGSADFSWSTFGDRARFRATEFSGEAVFDAAMFQDGVDMAVMRGRPSFLATVFRGDRAAIEITSGASVFDAADFEVSTLIVRSAVFGRATTIRFDGILLAMSRVEFASSVTIRASRATVALHDVSFARPSWIGGYVQSAERPRIVLLRETDVENLTFANADLHACRFVGAQNLDKLRLEGGTRFARSPLPVGSGREVLAEEHEWRSQRSGARRWEWYPPECHYPTLPGFDWMAKPEPVEPQELVTIYRDLRKGREDRKNEPGAADFYFGEMEMRRHAAATPRSEWAIIWLYWFVSGYGLRALRALTALVLTVVVFAALFRAVGFPRGAQAPFGSALLFSLESTTSLLRGTDRPLTALGEVLWIALRLLGPLFLALTLVSLRGRIKR